MEKIDTDWKTTNLKSLAKLFNRHFNELEKKMFQLRHSQINQRRLWQTIRNTGAVMYATKQIGSFLAFSAIRTEEVNGNLQGLSSAAD